MKINRDALLNSLPPEWPEPLLPTIRQQVEKSGVKIVVLDDDPTGTQTVQHVSVLTRWPEEALDTVFRESDPVIYILTNSRSLPLAEAQVMNIEIAANLKRAQQTSGREFVVVSRSDSTLRGHFPGEIDALAEGLGGEFDATLLIPAFFEGGRLTIKNVHYLAEGEWLTPAGESEYARDATFGYQSSNLQDWVSEKSGRRIRPEEVTFISVPEIRVGGPQVVEGRLRGLSGGQVCVVNAASYRDLEVFVLGLLQAEAAGKRFLYRSAASFVRVRAGLEPQPLLQASDLAGAVGSSPGLLVAGSHIQRSSQQIEALRRLPDLASLEVHVEALLDEARRENEIQRAASLVDEAMEQGKDTAIYTSRHLVTGTSQIDSLRISQLISSALVEIVQRASHRPGWVIAKGGITSSDIATGALQIRRAWVLGQAIPGVPIWQAGDESRWPGMVYVVFPGNVGGPEAIAEMVEIFRGVKSGGAGEKR